MNKIICFLILLSGLLVVNFSAIAQNKTDSVKNFKNTIRMNITNPMLFGEKNTIIGYERVFKNNQSITANVGRISFGKLNSINTDSIALDDSYEDKGFAVALDYRFYLKKENKHAAPRGVYIGPYYSFNYFNRVNSWTLDDQSSSKLLNTDITLKMNLVGVQLGYQFVFWNRLAIDFVLLGPGAWFYNLNVDMNSNLTSEEEQMVFDKINEAIDSKVPGNTIDIKPFEISKKGSTSTSSGGFRYVMHIGFRF